MAASTNKHLTLQRKPTSFRSKFRLSTSIFYFIFIMSNSGRGRGGLFQRGGRGGRGGGLIGSAVRGVAGGIGLVSESVSSYKEKRTAEKNASSSESSQQPQSSGIAASNEPPPNYEPQPSQHEDSTERQWELDETQSELLSSPQNGADSAQQTQDDKDLVASFLRVHGSSAGRRNAQLELPVILAQRRPKDRTRGFVRGYAPMLETVGIDQAAWLDFLDKFDQSTRASPWDRGHQLCRVGWFLCANCTKALPSAQPVYKTIEVAKDVQRQTKGQTSSFSQMNEQYFYPNGLCCLIMTWRPDSGRSHEVVDLTSTVASSIGSYDSGFTNKFKTSSGKAYGDFALPEAAPLIFPTLDVLAEADSEESRGLKQSLGEKRTYIQEYYDKRAQAQFALNRPDNLLANQQEAPKFTSRYADPSHPSNNGSLISLLTGGYVDPTKLRRGFRGQASEGQNQGQPSGARSDRQPGLPLPYKPVKAARKFLFNKDILYLMVVNMPTEDELREAKVVLDRR
ncbi:hypothetical protein FOXG_12399 [Fusarium oxysporum f. sp. lycopersici 4287]|uniref:Uncharacterized protein n=2 Tax=Fusarium oxysporum TaxID=5507 RepID=A0A0J9WRQ2_FUSO4|nr:hypothetical protein FOXG_12399 [Fusarium oxysporum f. sp. lycopersici 4287]KNB12927.1 hypothetical protein FOXG_12399 [Fusarium oxysporum f. sp. lycopersici 4287]